MAATVGFMQGAVGTFREVEHLLDNIAEAPNDLALATTALAIDEEFRGGRIAVVMCSQNMRLIEDNVKLLDAFHAIGMRMIQLTYNEANLVGDGCLEERNAGLSSFGRAVVRRMNDLGLIIDGSHTGKRTTMDAMRMSDAPFVFSHANAKAVSDTRRNIDDEQIEACAQTGGVIGINAFAAFVKADAPRSASIEDYLDHIEHVARVAGVDHVGIGLDQLENRRYYAGAGFGVDPNNSLERRARLQPASTYPTRKYVPGLESVSGLPTISEGLFRRGFGPDAVAKIIGLNWLRVYRQVWGE
jgi:membrane dipeptidase